MAVQLRCVDRDRKGETWTLDIGGERVVVRDAAGAAVAEFPPGDAAGRFQMPSFSENVKHLGIDVGGAVRRFDAPKEGLKEIRALLQRQIASAGPEAIAAVKNRAIRDLLVGAACAVGGIVLTVASYREAANKPEGGRYTVTYGLVIFGLVAIGKGVYGLAQLGQIRRLSQA